MLKTDEDGREVLVGLTFDESEWYFAYVAKLFASDDDEAQGRSAATRTERSRYGELHSRHEAARQQIIMAEAEGRQHPIKH